MTHYANTDINWISIPTTETYANAQNGVTRISKRDMRQERLSGIHNPWGISSSIVDAWAFLDICENPTILEYIKILIGNNIILWDSELYLKTADYIKFLNSKREGSYWPADPLNGAIAIICLSSNPKFITCHVHQFEVLKPQIVNLQSPIYVVRYIPSTSKYRRDISFNPNRRAMIERPLINYTNRPLWLVSGKDKANNDFVTGFSPVSPRWSGSPKIGD